MSLKKHLLSENASINEALVKINDLAQDGILFAHNEKNELVGSITDGDIRRGLIQGCALNAPVRDVLQAHPKFVRKSENAVKKLIELREKGFRIIPILHDDSDEIIGILNFRLKHSYLPIEAVIMAGGKGQRLRPLTETIPKPLLMIGEKPIVEYTIDRLERYGINKLWLSVNYLGDQLQEFVRNKETDMEISLVRETRPLGTIGSITLIDSFQKDTILLSNSDLLTNVDYEDFYVDFMESDADLSIVTIPYKVEVPYAVMEVSNGNISDFKEKPTYTYYSNGGIYLFKKEMLEFIPKGEVFSATDFMSKLIENGKTVRSFPHHGYWLDIGRHDDFKRAQEDVKLFDF
ncbi:MAG: nucleotidyltransferase [Fluviicola sp.]|jgi:dTDP-glucose pyrophosphorylase|uniref:nucleotidyltransferase family protein n=1 Tax=Fluviicola sp. TaxID=1917219 RepID=UPI002614B717|nr:nucleotidyltransferase family protein [Fluviicola sp.]MDF3027328.1 nucleotidyltransferase [Fluviicola sp.]